MTSFRVNEWWGTTIEGNEEFDVNCMVTGNLDNAKDLSNKICVGSLSGVLRVFKPQSSTFLAEDLVLENNLGEPILQLLTGKFLPVSNDVGIAVLHPRKVCVYELTTVRADTESGRATGPVSHYLLEKIYDHFLGLEGKHFTAFNMSCGPFGGRTDIDYLIVQSMDGKIQIFEQATHVLMRQFTDCLYPGPIHYLSTLDAIVTISTSCEAQCFRYQVLISSQSDIRDGPRANPSGVKMSAMCNTLMEWSVVLGEGCVAILDGYFSAETHSLRGGPAGSRNSSPAKGGAKSVNKSEVSEMVIVGEKHLFIVKDSGRLVDQRRLEKRPLSACRYNSAVVPNSHNFIIAFECGLLHVYAGFSLVWAAQTESGHAPVAMSVSTFGGKFGGMLTTLSDSGRLSVGYMGTRPSLSIASSATSRDLDYSKIDAEHRYLLGVIRDHQKPKKHDEKGDAQSQLVLRAQLPKALDTDAGPVTEIDVELPHFLVRTGGKYIKVMVRLYVAYAGSDEAKNVSITVNPPSFAYVVPQTSVVKTVRANSTPQMLRLWFYARADILATHLTAEVSATYFSARGEPRAISYAFDLPLFLACELRAASKTAAHKFTLETPNTPAVLPTILFDDLLVCAREGGDDVANLLGNVEQAIGLSFWAPSKTEDERQSSELVSTTASILCSKSSGRYRVQADTLSALTVVLAELERRLERAAAQHEQTHGIDASSTEGMKSGGHGKVQCSDPLPLPAYFECIGKHFNLRLQLRQKYSDINDASHLHRVIMKRLLTRFKEKNATPLNGMDKLMEEAYHKLLALTDESEALQESLEYYHTEISGLSRMLVQLAGLRLQLPVYERKLLLSYLCPSLPPGYGSCTDELEATGWEELVETNLTFLLKTALSKTPKDSVKLHSQELSMPEDIETLKQRLSLLFVRLEEGRSLIPPSNSDFASTE